MRALYLASTWLLFFFVYQSSQRRRLQGLTQGERGKDGYIVPDALSRVSPGVWKISHCTGLLIVCSNNGARISGLETQ